MCSEAKEKTIKYLVKYGMISTGALVNAYFTMSKDCLASILHLILEYFLSILVMFLRISVRLGINLLKKNIFPMND